MNAYQAEDAEESLSPDNARLTHDAFMSLGENAPTAAFRAAARLSLQPDAASGLNIDARRMLIEQTRHGLALARGYIIVFTSVPRSDDFQAHVRNVLATDSPQDRQAAAEGLTISWNPAAIPGLLARLQSKDPQARAAAAEALSGSVLATQQHVKAALREATGDRSGAVALLAAVGVARSGDTTLLRDVLRRIRSGELDLSAFADRSVPLTPLRSELQAAVAGLATSDPDNVAGIIARTLSTPAQPGRRADPDVIGDLSRLYVGQDAPSSLQITTEFSNFVYRFAMRAYSEQALIPQVGSADKPFPFDIGQVLGLPGPPYRELAPINRHPRPRLHVRSPMPRLRSRDVEKGFPGGGLAGGGSPGGGSPGGWPPSGDQPWWGPPEPVRRHLQGKLPERVKLGELVQLLVRVAIEPTRNALSGLRESRLDPLRIGPFGLSLGLVVEAPGFKSRSPLRGTLRIPPQGDSGWELFELEATRPGVYTITVMAFNGGVRVGVLPMEITVDPDVVTSAPALRIAPVRPRNREPGELSLVISYNQDLEEYRYQLIDWTIDVPEESRTAPLKERPKDTIENLVAQLNQVARREVGWDAPQTLAWLKGKGLELWRLLIPLDLQHALLDRLGDIKSMMIYTDGDVVPWELLCPASDQGFLVERFPVARWLKGLDGPVTSLNMRPAAFALPEGAPSAAGVEIDAVERILERCGCSMLPVAGNLNGLLAVLEAHEFSMLHFASHNTFAPDAPDTSTIMFGAQPFVPAFLEDYRGDDYRKIPPAFREHAPIIFMNACRTDGKAGLFTQLYGWAEKFLSAGSGAFIGSSWEVVDSSARRFAEGFYDQFASGVTLGDALLQARNAIHDVTGDPTWLAYTLYGDPKATVTTTA